jgi:hypothetical protein
MKYYTYQCNYELYRAIKRIKSELKLTWSDITAIAEAEEKRIYRWVGLHKRGKARGALPSEETIRLLAERLGLKLVITLEQQPINTEWKKNINNLKKDRQYRNAKKRPVQPVSRTTRVYRQAREQ